jgi:filamentous hemagglutinin
VVPGGLIDVGLANPPATLASRPPSTLGIVAQEAGNVDIYSQGDVNVNASLIFTLGGGNILIWSDEGSIDAGRGAKTAVSAPPPTVLINSDGTVSINFSGAAAGSGIRTIQTNPSVAAGNVDLVAPAGTVNAGDAGIGAAGNINIAAQSVIGVSNIQFGGTATGVPAQVSNVNASLSGASSAASGASNASTSAVEGNSAQKESAPLAQASMSWLDVFVTGLGEENCKPDDIECLKRQKTPTR